MTVIVNCCHTCLSSITLCVLITYSTSKVKRGILDGIKDKIGTNFIDGSLSKGRSRLNAHTYCIHFIIDYRKKAFGWSPQETYAATAT